MPTDVPLSAKAQSAGRMKRMALVIGIAVLSIVGVVGLISLQRSKPNGAVGGVSGTAASDVESDHAAARENRIEPELLDLDSLLIELSPSGEHIQLMWDAREVMISSCMSQRGYEYVPRPNDDSTAEWNEWQTWYDQLVAADPSFGFALFGVDGESDLNVGGCQLTAYQSLHRDGIPAEARLADLYNSAAAAVFAVGSPDLGVPLYEVDRVLVEWKATNASVIEQFWDDIEMESAAAREVLQDE